MNKTHAKYGVIIAVILIVYFLIIRLLGLHENPWLRVLNGLIVAYGIYAAIKQKKVKQGKNFNYYSGAKTGVYAGFTRTIIFVIFMAVYMFHLDISFSEKIMDNRMKNYYQGTEILLFILAIEGFASTVVLTLAFMQKFKPSRNIPKKAS